jgi:cell division protease FtsH
MIDEEVRRIVDEVVAMTREIILAERQNIERIADVLLEKETIFSEDIEAVLGKSAQQLAKEAAEAVEVVDDNTDVKYIIESSAEVEASEAE